MDKNTEQWNEINELLSKNGAHLNVLEEEIDIEIQREYFNLAHSITEKPRKFKQLCKKYTENINQLFDENIPEKQKKEMLTVLATLDDISIYRAIENFSKQDTPLKSWATVALQQSRMLIQSNLLEDPEIFISTGLGGRGNLLRYFCVFLNRQKGEFPGGIPAKNRPQRDRSSLISFKRGTGTDSFFNRLLHIYRSHTAECRPENIIFGHCRGMQPIRKFSTRKYDHHKREKIVR